MAHDLAALAKLGFNRSRFSPELLADVGWIGRVVAQHRGHLDVDDGSAVQMAMLAPRLRRPEEGPHARPTVGDWVELSARTEDARPLLVRLLPRHSALTRAAAGDRYAKQTLAANVDRVLVVVGLDRDFNVRRIERYLTIIAASGAMPLIILTKADLTDDADEVRLKLRKQFPTVLTLSLDATDPDAARQLAPELHAGETIVLVGSSGAGKSTLTNTLLAFDRQATGTVRERDQRGRHTTTHRSLHPLPSGALLIDTPGLREIKLTDDAPAQTPAFDDIERLAAQCRFRDCRHLQEPGCVVRAAIIAGELSRARLDNYIKLGAERSHAQVQARAVVQQAARQGSAKRRSS